MSDGNIKNVKSKNTNTGQSSVNPGTLPGLEMPPEAPPMTVADAILGVIPYWGVERTINAYRKAVEAGVSATKAVEMLYSAMSDLEIEKERWENVDKLREQARNQISAQVTNSEANLIRAENELARVKLEQDDLNTQIEMGDTRAEIVKNQIEAELARVRAEKSKAEGHVDESDSHSDKLEATLREANRLQESIEKVTKKQEELVTAAGGFENLSETDLQLWEALEDAKGWAISDGLGPK